MSQISAEIYGTLEVSVEGASSTITVSIGTPGPAASVTVGTTTTGAPGTQASVVNAGTTAAAVLNFTIPQGATGATGATGPAGVGVPIGGTDGQVLAKIDTTDYNTTWVTPFALQVRNQVRNETGAQLDKGTVVYVNGAAGNKVTVTKAQANTDATSAQTFAVLLEDIPNNQNGYAVTSGLLENLDTSAYAAGTQVYLSPTTAGTFTATKPSAPDHLVYVGVIERSHANQGSMLVRIQNGYELDELHDVAIASKTNNDLLAYESATNLWKNKSYSTLGLLTSATAASTYYLQTNPAGYIDATALAPYLTIASAAATYQTTAGMSAYLTTANNLSELTATASTARTNLGLGTAAVEPATKLVPTGGTTGQVLAKASNSNWDLTWTTAGGGSGGGVDVQTFGSSTTSGTFSGASGWQKPSGAKWVHIFLIGGGGGGGSGAKQATTSIRGGGGGGAGATFFHGVLHADYLGSTATVVVGAGGTGANPQGNDSSSGSVGTEGGTTSFASLFKAVGGNAGNGGSGTGGGVNGAGRLSQVLANISSVTGAGGSGGTGSGSPGGGINAIPFCPQGGGGGGGATANSTNSSNGGAGGTIFTLTTSAGVFADIAGGSGGVGSTSTPATNGVSNTTQGVTAATGGGGGFYRTATTGGTGGAGGWPGGGGGGGGAADNGVGLTSGRGGTGGNGYAVIITYT